MASVIVTGTFTVEWDLDRFRAEWAEPDMSDEDILAECIFSVEQAWDTYATTPDTVGVQGEIVE